MKTKKKTSKEVMARTIRFASAKQVDLIKEAAELTDLPFNTFVTRVCEMTADQLLKTDPADPKKSVTLAFHKAIITER